ncbi:MAG TPA: 5-amino-6-(D-ribitylamino)uracil--L-tyrosine 4-hydroxyphenyl transferase CofH, partial [Phenylobacterium sp.]|nr:5-amino-6-(D-ribitylamino)uracil--L-tyrosine 4-hydroxyphenyl transferase CofH [Phenylobacterium sp.]
AHDIARLFAARGEAARFVCHAADEARREANGETVTYVVNRNINYTNICTYSCTFCAFSKGPRKARGGDAPYLLDLGEVRARAAEAWARGASEVCLQGGIHPTFDGRTYLGILEAVKAGAPDIHVHAFSPLEVTHGAATLGLDVEAYLQELKSRGLGSLPGTAAEILTDPVRALICPDKLSASAWLDVVRAAHTIGLPTTSTMMFGHVDGYEDWAVHLLRLLDLQRQTSGFTEFVPLPFVAQEAPIFRKGLSRAGPTYREAVLVHAVARLVFQGRIRNIQTSWVKMGMQGAKAALQAGANDLGGVLMNESITRAAGAVHGQEMSSATLMVAIASLGRTARQRTTLYGVAAREIQAA